jgi:hypothetical protein
MPVFGEPGCSEPVSGARVRPFQSVLQRLVAVETDRSNQAFVRRGIGQMPRPDAAAAGAHRGPRPARIYGKVAAGIAAIIAGNVSATVNASTTFARDGGNDVAVSSGIKVPF